MEGINFAEPLIDDAIAALRANLPERIAAYNASERSKVTLIEPAPDEYHFGAKDPLLIGATPIVEVAAVRGMGGDFDIDGPEGQPTWGHDVTLSVVVWHEGDRGELEPTYRMSLGLAKCVIEVLTQRDALPTASISNEIGAIEWRPDVIPADMTDDGREFNRWQVPVLITLRLETDETFAV